MALSRVTYPVPNLQPFFFSRSPSLTTISGVYCLEVKHKTKAVPSVSCSVNYNTPDYKAAPMQLELLETLERLVGEIKGE
jgi:hypothetical protein